MSIHVETSQRPRRKRRRNRLFPKLLFLVILAVVGYFIWMYVQYGSHQRVTPYDGRQQVIVHKGKAVLQSYQMKEDEVLLPFSFLKEQIDQHLFWDEPSRSVIITTEDKVIQMPSEKLQAFVNKKPVDLRVPVTIIDGEEYVPVSPLEKIYGIHLRKMEGKDVISVENNGDTIQQGQVISEKDKTLPMRLDATKESPIVSDLVDGQKVTILNETNGWYHLLSNEGVLGYLPMDQVKKLDSYQVEVNVDTPKERNTAWKPDGQKLNVVWEQVVNRNPKLDSIPKMSGLHVVAPTWFELKDAKGTVGNKADASYVRWAHREGYKVWAVVSNGFNPDWTKAVLSDFETRQKMITQIVQYANLYQVDGINIDFEDVYLDDKQRFVQFVRELTPYLHEQELTVSVDVTMMHGSDRWSNFLDRKALAEAVDYTMLMAYDEHWGSSPVAGSVASLPWVENGLKQVLTEVPKEKLLLGMPFYTRLWKEVKQDDGSVKVSSRALYMSGAKKWMEERNLKATYDEATGQNYVSYFDKQENATYKMWLEDETSLKKRIEVSKKYDLAGVASWRRGFEEPEIWQHIHSNLN
ncbi:glycosyl hydrolase family 18 protein [Brevibacillus laterosporus]|uniref:glycosyl hydrolase family 18 protein n=1 Tax=Brevibacillus laterosporus TaxID=1465 RepID=UPI00215C15AA|nr:glycosyl hydrolase family 18 protein [Brevibacillus laterosporus]MCR8997196.1 glycosyl hydrolase family 18 protein [Brevibacillus laterosporus]